MQKKIFYCSNCGKDGHLFKNCDEPVTSYGIILLYFDMNNQNSFIASSSNNGIKNFYDQAGIVINGAKDLELFCQFKNSIKFLLIQRKHTLGFLEFLRGRYVIENVDGIIFLFEQMTSDEITKIKNHTFDELWDEVWGENKNKFTYQNEYISSKDKFNKLSSDDNGYLNLNFYINNVVPVWSYAEWGFPKGRRNLKEENRECAIREFMEETDFKNDDFMILDNIQPIEETFIGTNGINYKHVYYIGMATTDKTPSINPNNKTQLSEIGNIEYMTYEEIIKIIRPYHVERQKIVTQIYIYFMNKIITYYNINGT
jgi:8-oxo-dGTP pyrophosphatase MutT (NUDIX family)